MLRRLMVLMAVLCAAPASRGEEHDLPLVLTDGYGNLVVSVTPSVVGADLRFVATYPKPVSSYLDSEYSNVALEFFIDIDGDVKTGEQKMTDQRRGTDVSALVVVRSPLRKGVQTEEVVVSHGNAIVKTNAGVRADGKTITASVPLADLKIRKDHRVRLVLLVEGVLLEKTLTP